MQSGVLGKAISQGVPHCTAGLQPPGSPKAGGGAGGSLRLCWDRRASWGNGLGRVAAGLLGRPHCLRECGTAWEGPVLLCCLVHCWARQREGRLLFATS